jgi:hypothetical protein
MALVPAQNLIDRAAVFMYGGWGDMAGKARGIELNYNAVENVRRAGVKNQEGTIAGFALSGFMLRSCNGLGCDRAPAPDKRMFQRNSANNQAWRAVRWVCG